MFSYFGFFEKYFCFIIKIATFVKIFTPNKVNMNSELQTIKCIVQ